MKENVSRGGYENQLFNRQWLHNKYYENYLKIAGVCYLTFESILQIATDKFYIVNITRNQKHICRKHQM